MKPILQVIWKTARISCLLLVAAVLQAQIVYIDGGSITVEVVAPREKLFTGDVWVPLGPLVNILEGYPDQNGGGGGPEETGTVGRWYFREWIGPWENRRDWSQLAMQTTIDNFSYTESLAGKTTLTGSVSSSVTSKLSVGEVVAASSEQQFQESFSAAQEVSYSVKPRKRAILQLWVEMWTRPFTEELRVSLVPLLSETAQAYQGKSTNFKFSDGPL